MKRQDRRLGHEHHDDLAPGALIELFERAGLFECELETHQRMRHAPYAEFEADVIERMAGLGDDHPERTVLETVLKLVRDRGVGLTGTAIVVARRRG